MSGDSWRQTVFVSEWGYGVGGPGEGGSAADAYRCVVTATVGAALALAELPIPEMLAAIERADALGAVMDPTLYRRKAAAMREDASLLRAALPLRALGLHLRTMMATPPAEAEEERTR